MSFDENTKLAVWKKAKVVASPTRSSEEWRQDECSAWIKFSEYGNRKSDFGWEIDHISPQSNGGSDQLSNLRPLHWKNNASKNSGRLSCVVKSNGDKNVGS